MKKLLSIVFLFAFIGLSSQTGITPLNLWKTNGNAIATNTNFIGTTTNYPLIFKTNNTMVGMFSNQSKFYVGSDTLRNSLGIGAFRVSHGGLSVDLGSHLFGFAGMHITSTIKPNYTNFAVYGDGTTSTYFNSPTDSSTSFISCGNSTAQIQLRGKQTNSTGAAFYVIGGARTRITSGNNASNMIFYGNNSEWKAGAIALYHDKTFLASVLTAAAASTLTDSYNGWFVPNTASTNMTITRNWGIGTSGNAHVTGSIVIGSAAKTPAAVADVAGTMSVSSTATISGVLSVPTLTAVGNIYTESPSNFWSSGSLMFRNVSSYMELATSLNGVSLPDTRNIKFSTTGTGSKIGIGTTDKFAFWNATPITQPVNTTALNSVLVNTGLMQSGATSNIINTPLSINKASAPVASAALEIESTTQGFLPPRMTATQGSAISSPAEGLMIYVTDTNGTFTAKGWWGYNGATWEKLNN